MVSFEDRFCNISIDDNHKIEDSLRDMTTETEVRKFVEGCLWMLGEIPMGPFTKRERLKRIYSYLELNNK